jgi:hypothetical protein
MITRRPSTTHTSAARLTAQQISCQQGYHTWTPTFCQGEFLCQLCGVRAYCPECVPVQPSMKWLHRCSPHRKQEEDKER